MQAPPLPNSKNGFAAEFDGGPIPGQSLTKPPGSYPFEQPPQFSTPDEAFESLVNALADPKATDRLLNMMELGMPVYTIVYTLLMSGFTEGKWTPDVAMLMAEPLSHLMFRLARDAGIKAESGIKEEEDDMLQLVLQKRMKEMPEPELEMPQMGGLMEPM